MHDATAELYTVLGLVLSLAGATLALTRARAPASFYAADVYHMTVRSHRRFAAVSAGFAAAFLAGLHWTNIAIPVLAVYVLLLILYASSFARGFSDQDE